MTESRGFGPWLRAERKLLGLTTKELGERIGCSATTIEKIEAGSRLPSTQLARLFADFFAVTPEERQAFVLFARGALSTTRVPPLAGVQDGTSEPPAQISGAGESAPWQAGVDTGPGGPPAHIPSNLPSPLTSFVGSHRAIAELTTLLERPAVRLLSLTGPPGVGKTRCALQAAGSSLPLFPDGVFFVGLASLRDPDMVPSAIARVLGVRETAGAALVEDLKEKLRDKRMLLVLDNFEQVMPAGPILTNLLSVAPNLKALVTTRQILHLYGEYNFPVPPLTVPQAAQTPHLTAGELARYEAVQLFVERAGAARHGFHLTDENARSVAEICIWLDGLPLGIELAACRSTEMSPQEMESKLAGTSSMMSFLVGGPRDLPPHQQALRSAIEWSYNLLDDGEQTLFRRLSAFTGGCTAHTADAVCGPREKNDMSRGGSLDVIRSTEKQIGYTSSVLDDLCDKSLLFRQATDAEERFWMLETLREYALEQLTASGEEGEVLGSHAGYFLALVEQAEPQLLRGGSQAEWLERLERDHGNLLAALGHLVERAPELALRMSGAMWPFWEVRGHISEWRIWIDRVLGQAPVAPTRARADALHALGRLHALQGDYGRARAWYDESLAIRRRLDDKVGVASSLNNLGIISMENGDYPGALRLYRESLQLRREMGDKYGVAALLNNMANILIAQGDYAEARFMHDESLAIRRELGNPYGIASSLQNLGIVAMYEGDYSSATRFLGESLEIRTEIGYKHGIASLLSNLGQVDYYRKNYGDATKRLKESLSLYLDLDDNQSVAECLILLGEIAAARGDAKRAARLFGAADAQMQSVGFKLLAPEQAEYERNLQSVQTQLGERPWEAAWEEGMAMPLDTAASYALERVIHA